ncbi:hypothetical protein [Paraliomyxa miuraensis]|uniref:hypothetical protein n=1 Tax=Paraliomyxa miuraensis TaxID=376150 RepID=UPI00224D240A|nr:hypothetical protein [Paraliomyxa miuraensis]MCX4243170.1 hypothetical protein [Paraliomyxa miuraensis]
MSHGPVDHRSAAVTMALVALLGSAVIGSVGCGPRDGAQRRTPFATQIAYGRPETCPEGAVDPHGDGTPSPMDLRCSYDDGTGSIPTRIRGRVSLEGSPGTVGRSPGRVEVVVHEAPKAIDGPIGGRVAHASTDPQGVFVVSAMLRSGEYVLVVRTPGQARPLVEQRITLGGPAGHRIEGIQLVVPRRLDDLEPPADDRVAPTP